LGLFLLSGIVAAQGVFQQQARLDSPDPVANESFGSAVALSADGKTALVGDPIDRCAPNNLCGAVFVFSRISGSWVLQQKITAPDTNGFDSFGAAVALSADGNTALVGATGKPCASPVFGVCGATYVFVRSGSSWSFQQELVAFDGSDSDNFGISVAVSSDGGTATIGSINAHCGAINQCGAVYVFVRSGASWSIQQKLISPSPAFLSTFGFAVTLSGDGNILLAGEPQRLCPALSVCGSVYVFTRSGAVWSLQQTLTGPDPQVADEFGETVALSRDGTVALVGANTYDCMVTGKDCGTAYLFTRSGGTWRLEQDLRAADATANDRFGRSVSLSDDGSLAFVGAGTACPGGSNCGAVYAFVRNAGLWSQVQKIVSSDQNDQEIFWPSAASADGRMVLIGAPGKECTGGTCGAAYVFVLSQAIAEVPAVTGLGLVLLVLLIAAAGLARLRRGLSP
jgi:hypothetical protein